jgi:hypothetical protein
MTRQTQRKLDTIDYAHAPRRQQRAWLTEFLRSYFLFIFKNVIGWVFIIGALPLGVMLPGPGGIPLFLIGFALVTFPGKRRLTSRVMRGRPFDLQAHIFTFATAVVSVLITLLLLWMFIDRYERLLEQYNIQFAHLVGICLLALVVTWLVMRLGLQVLNWTLTRMPLIRRRIRPWLRRQGFHLLPPRRKRAEALEGATAVAAVPSEDEILLIHERHHHRIRWLWTLSKPWLRRAVAVGITVAIFYWILRPITRNWHSVYTLVWQVSVWRFAVASGMFAIFLFLFRALVWRRILHEFGFKLPVAAATRIWSTSELARYLPGIVWQVVGRIYLVKPYGVRGSICSVSQVLELAIFLLANILVAVACLLYFGIKQLEGAAESWVYAAIALIPVLLVLLHPRVFYGTTDRVMKMLGKPVIANRIGGARLTGMLGWNIVGLLWQSLALYVLLAAVLDLKLDWWWMLAGAYCLAWTAGFLAVWAPGGIGVRELVFMTAMRVVLPEHVRAQFDDPAVLMGLLAFLSLLLRVWATAGEIILALVAYALDLRGALGLPDAPGRVGFSSLRADSTVGS